MITYIFNVSLIVQIFDSLLDVLLLYKLIGVNYKEYCM